MIECYFSDCKNHCKDEPFCGNINCTASDDEIEKFQFKRTLELQQLEYDSWYKSEPKVYVVVSHTNIDNKLRAICSSFEDAEKMILKNIGDIREPNVTNASIETVIFNCTDFVAHDIVIYNWIKTGDRYDEGYFERTNDIPERLQGICNFYQG